MTYFKIGCYVLILTCFFHLTAHFQEPLPANETEKQLLDLMATYQIDVGLGTITMTSIQKGMGLSFSLLFLWTGVLGLFLVKLLGQNLTTLRKISIVYISALSLELAISVVYFFIVPTTCIALALLFFVIAAFRIK